MPGHTVADELGVSSALSCRDCPSSFIDGFNTVFRAKGAPSPWPAFFTAAGSARNDRFTRRRVSRAGTFLKHSKNAQTGSLTAAGRCLGASVRRGRSPLFIGPPGDFEKYLKLFSPAENGAFYGHPAKITRLPSGRVQFGR